MAACGRLSGARLESSACEELTEAEDPSTGRAKEFWAASYMENRRKPLERNREEKLKLATSSDVVISTNARGLP
jgi:hypothetical protein